MTERARQDHFELELRRVSTRGLRPVSRPVERRLSTSRAERISLFPGWENPGRTGLLGGVIAHLESLGLIVESLVRPGLRSVDEVATGSEARQRYLTEAAAEGATWPGQVLILSDAGERGALLASDPDGVTLYIDFWGRDARAVGDSIFDLVWANVRDAR